MTQSLLKRSILAMLVALALPLTTTTVQADEPLVQNFDNAEWTVDLLRFDQDGIVHTAATVSYGGDAGLVVYCSHETVIALRVDPFYPKGATPQSNIRFVVKEGSKTLYDQSLGPFSFADNSYGGAINKELAAAMKRGSSIEVSDPTIGLDNKFPLRGSSKALASLKCV
ncbi:MAG: hypothetical protein RIC87_17755 [Kiloniellales bacterium]